MSKRNPFFSLRENFLSLFVRTSERDAVLDGIRAISILLVVAYHSIAIPAVLFPAGIDAYLLTIPQGLRWMAQGDKGVDMFFVLSGFLIGRMLLTEQQKHGRLNYGQFYFRRFIRLFPAYAVLLLLLLAAPIKQDKIYLLANLFYVNNFLDYENMIAPWTWSLAVEEQFYLLLPMFLTLCFCRTQHRWKLLAALIASAYVIRAALFLQHPDFYLKPQTGLVLDADYVEIINVNLYTRFDGLLFGFCAAYFLFSQGNALQQRLQARPHLITLSMLLAITVIAAILATPIETMHESWPAAALFAFRISHQSLFSAAIAVLLICMLHPRGLAKPLAGLLAARCWLPLAQLSYSIYLFHEIFAGVVFQLVRNNFNAGNSALSVQQVGLVLLITTVLSLIFGAIIYLLIEKPAMNRRVQWWQQLTGARGQQVTSSS